MDMEEKVILKNLIRNNDYFLKVYPFIEEKLFSDKTTKELFKCIRLYNEKFNKQVPFGVIDIYVENAPNLSDDQHTALMELVLYCKMETLDESMEWLMDSTLAWIQKRKFYNALIEGADKFDKGNLDTDLSRKLDEALSVTFSNDIGMEFTEYERRWEQYTKVDARVPFRIGILNNITRGGLTKKTLNCLMSSDTGGFKSGTMCSLASDYIRDGLNVLYISMEMGEKEVMERIDANMLDTEIDNIVLNGRETYCHKMTNITQKTNGRLIVKQFPTSNAHVGHFRYLLKELKLKRAFTPDVIIIDYLNICASMRLKGNDAGNSYTYVKAITEEIRGLAIETDTIIWTATQSNRNGSGNEMLSVTDVSESYGLVAGLDLMLGIVTTEEFDEQNKLLFVQLKNRYADKNVNHKFFLGVNKAKMQVYELIGDKSTFAQEQETDENEVNELLSRSKRKRIEL